MYNEIRKYYVILLMYDVKIKYIPYNKNFGLRLKIFYYFI